MPVPPSWTRHVSHAWCPWSSKALSSATQAKTVLAEMVDTGGDPESIASEKGFEAMDTSELEGLVDGLIEEHPEEWTRFCDGDAKITGFFVGKVMKATKGQADGKAVTGLLQARKG